MTNGSITSEIARSRDEPFQASISARLLAPVTRQLFLEAGLKPGMRVLDCWSGAGDVASIARELVGPEGYVRGFDSSGQMVGHANDRVMIDGFNNVEFVEADIENLPFDTEFDAVVGRIVLAYREQPVRDLKAVARCLKPSGIMVFQELDHMAARTIPPIPLIDQVRGWFIEAFRRSGIELQMGLKLYSAFQAAGLEPPRLRLDGLIGGAESTAPTLITGVVRRLLPQIEAWNIATAEEVQIETLEERMRLELARTGGIMQTSLVIGAWSRLAR